MGKFLFFFKQMEAGPGTASNNRIRFWCPVVFVKSFSTSHLQLVVIWKIFIIPVIIISSLSSTILLVELLKDGVDNLFQLCFLLVEVFLLCVVVGLEPVKNVIDSLFDRLLVFFGQFSSKFLLVVELRLESKGEAFKTVLGFDLLTHHSIFLSEFFGSLKHSLDFSFRRTTFVGGDGDGFAGSGGFVRGSNVDDTVGVNFKRDFDLRDTTRSWRNSSKFELAEVNVVFGHGSFSLEHLDQHSGLVVLVGGEHLGFLGGDDAVLFNELGHNSSDGFNTEGQRGHVNEEDIFDDVRVVSLKDTGLNSSTVGNSFIGVDSSVGFFSSEEVFHQLLDLGNTSGTTNQHNFVKFGLFQSSVFQDGGNWLEGLSEQVVVEFFKTSTGQGLGEVKSLDEGFDFDLDLVSCGQSTLGFFNFTSKFGQSTRVLLDVNLVLTLERLDEEFNDTLVKVFTT